VATDPNAFNRLRYAVSDPVGGINAINEPFTRTDGMRQATMPSIAAASNPPGNVLLAVCGTGAAGPTGCNAAVPLANRGAVAVVWSLGANGLRGDVVGQPDSPSPDELENLDGDETWISRAFSDAVGARFDDQVVWIAPPALFARMVTAGRLP
jgi:hypothetical protein